jgi:hypothetical protein
MEKILPQESMLSVVRFVGGLQIIGDVRRQLNGLYIDRALEIMVAQVPMNGPQGIAVQNIVQLVPISAAASGKGENIGPFKDDVILLCKPMPREAQLAQQYMNATTGLIFAPGMMPPR